MRSIPGPEPSLRRLTRRAADGWESARFTGIFPASGLYCSQAAFSPAAANAIRWAQSCAIKSKGDKVIKKSIGSVFLAFVFLTVLLSGCAPAPTPVPAAVSPTPIPPTTTPLPTPTPTRSIEEQPTENDLNGLITTQEITTFSADLEIVDWKLDEKQSDESCQWFIGKGKSSTEIFAGNCIYGVESRTFGEVLEYLKDNQVIKPSAVAIESSYEYPGDFALYRFFDETRGYAVYDALLVRDNFLYWARIDFTTPIVYSPESLFDDYGEALDTFLHEILTRNLRHSQ